MVTQHILRTYEGIGPFGKNEWICDRSRSIQMPSTDHLTEIDPYGAPISEFPSIIITVGNAFSIS